MANIAFIAPDKHLFIQRTNYASHHEEILGS